MESEIILTVRKKRREGGGGGGGHLVDALLGCCLQELGCGGGPVHGKDHLICVDVFEALHNNLALDEVQLFDEFIHRFYHGRLALPLRHFRHLPLEHLGSRGVI